MKFPVGSLLHDPNNRDPYLIVVDDYFDEDGEEGVFVNFAQRPIRKWDAPSNRLHQIISRPLLKQDGTWIDCDTMLSPDEFSYCQRIA